MPIDRVKDGMMRHPSDSPAWKTIDARWLILPMSLGISVLVSLADGINPHTSLSSKYSCWPILLVIYNLPPWLVMKRKFTMLTLMISGPSQPGNDIDVYLAPLIDDLSKLWYDGVNAYDAYRNEAFNLRAMLLWTINDFPAFGNLSGYSVKGYNACPICEEKTCSRYLTHSRKICYMGHRKFLPPEHVFRTWKKAFDGKQEFEMPPPPLSGRQLVEKLNKIQFNLGKRKSKSKKRKGGKGVTNEPQGPWKKKSIFFELEYWEHLVLRHNLDVMHIEKNVSDSLINTLFNIPGRSKDGIKSRLDLKEMGIRGNLHPEIIGKRTFLPPACYALTKEEKRSFCTSLSHVKVPEGYSSNISNLVDMDKLILSGLKSHDHHILMQHILPVSIRSVLPKKVRYAITRGSFVEFCSDFLSNVATVGSCLPRFDNEISKGGRGVSVCDVSRADREEAHRLVLQNVDEVQPYIEKHFDWIKTTYPSKSRNHKWVQDEHYRNFSTWLKEKVIVEMSDSPNNVSQLLLSISHFPSFTVLKYQSYYINSTQFNTKDRDASRKTQNSGVMIVASAIQVASSKDKNPIECDMTFYGVIKEIWELDYISFRIPVFLCDWVRSDNGVKEDEFGFKLVDLNRVGHKSDRFIMASQAKQVFYMSDPIDGRWSVVLTTQPKDYDYQESGGDLYLNDKTFEINPPPIDVAVRDEIISSREDGEGLWIE
ncbi:uncharacterized protein LOC115700084 [Cannabis sativa]|uniref:uncharacterized protein LOC115700084 n=1 Tax=Cannabis sativa TaxID=3483 RepID=UPI0029CA5291|nr:uncharacterized protein LOC115700084 [Cannabis sativa]